MSKPSGLPMLDIRELSLSYPGARNWHGKVIDKVDVLQDVSLTIAAGETLGVIGGSGCGKSTLAKAILGLVSADCGEISIDGQRLEPKTSLEERRRRAEYCQMIFQDPQSSLDPRFRVWQLITEILSIRADTSRRERLERATEIGEKVGITRSQLQRYPHELSGGQRQRVAIARALAVHPKLLILDEPTSALDVTIQAQVLNLLLTLKRQHGLTYLFISHDLSVIAHMCDRVAVMQAGRIVEVAETEQLMRSPTNDYTRQLIDSVPRVGGKNGDPCEF